ncbi:uracil-DNA glycosylase [Sphingomonas sp. I4]
MSDIRLHESWLEPLRSEFDEPYMQALKTFLADERASGQRVFPRPTEWFRALDLTPLDQVRVVILGQDPIMAKVRRMAWPFGTARRAAAAQLGQHLQGNGDRPGADPARPRAARPLGAAGVLLLNSVLTVRMGQAASHQGRGWERFTDAVIRAVAARPEPVVFILWGAYAQKKAGFVREMGAGRHCVLTSVHPSPLSARGGFFGSKPFSKANAFLVEHGREPIDWALPPLS